MLLEVQHVRKEFQNHTHALTDSSTYYRLHKAAVEALSSVLWGFSTQDTQKTLDCFFPPDV